MIGIYSIVLLAVFSFAVVESLDNAALMSYRLLRTFYSLGAGLVIGCSGALLQAALRNPLVDHYVVGVGSGALFATYVAILAGAISPAVSGIAAIGGGLSALLITTLMAKGLRASEFSFVLSGIAVNTIFSGLSLLASFFVARVFPYSPYLLMGSFVLAVWDKLPLVLAALIVSAASYVLLARPLNALALGDITTKQLGWNPLLVRIASVVLAGASASLVVSAFGILGFVGLVSPHIARLMLRTSDNRLVIPCSMTVGSMVLYSTDALSRYVLSAVVGEVPAGAIASVLGGPFFIVLLARRLRGVQA